MKPTYPLRTPRLTLAPLTEGDLDALLVYRGDAEVCRYLPFEPMDRVILSARLAGDLGRTEITGEGQALTLGVRLVETGELIGDVVLFYRSAEQRSGELGYVFDPAAAGHGYATEACLAVLAWAFEALQLHRVVARLDARNQRSAALAARLGMRLEARFVQNELFKGEWSDELVFALLEQDWNARTG